MGPFPWWTCRRWKYGAHVSSMWREKVDLNKKMWIECTERNTNRWEKRWGERRKEGERSHILLSFQPWKHFNLLPLPTKVMEFLVVLWSVRTKNSKKFLGLFYHSLFLCIFSSVMSIFGKYGRVNKLDGIDHQISWSNAGHAGTHL